MKNFKSGSQNKKLSTKDSFLEAFRDLGSDTATTFKDDLIKKGVRDIFDNLSPFKQNSSPEESSRDFPNLYSQEAEIEKKYRSRISRLEIIHREGKILFTSEQKEIQKQVNVLQEEIKKLAKSTSDLASEAKEAEITAMQEAPLIGTYHLNFFIRLRRLISELRSQIQESSFWLASWNKKAQKRNYYWNQFKKSGSKFMLSSDRYMATQAG